MSTVIKLPTAAVSYYRVRRSRAIWLVELVTPGPVKPIVTTIAKSPKQGAATHYARALAAEMQRPLRLPRGSSS